MTILNIGHNPSGSYDKLTPWDAFRVAKALNSKVVIPDHYENWACTFLDPDQLEEIVKKNDPTIKTVILRPGALFVYPDDQDIKRFKYPDWQERFHWEKARYTLEDER